MMNKEEFFRRLGIHKTPTSFKTFSHQQEQDRRKRQIERGILKAENGVIFFKEQQ